VSAPVNPLEEALAATVAGQLPEAELLLALWDAELLLPQPFAEATGPSNAWQIAVFDGVSPVYTSERQLVKAIGREMAYARVPGPTLVKHWNPERPMALNLGADDAVRIPGPVVKALEG
jgi:hypothetical protein